MKEITKEDWKDYPKRYKTTIRSQKYNMINNPETGGTILTPVKIMKS